MTISDSSTLYIQYNISNASVNYSSYLSEHIVFYKHTHNKTMKEIYLVIPDHQRHCKKCYAFLSIALKKPVEEFKRGLDAIKRFGGWINLWL